MTVRAVSGSSPTANDIIAHFSMKKHPEGGHYVETYRDVNEGCGRGVCTAIYFLLRAGERSHWHRIDAVEIWHWYAGAPLLLALSVDGCGLRGVTLGNDIFAGQQPQVVVPVGAWQAAESLGAWTLTGCTVAPAFDFAGFEMAPPDWVPGS